MTDVDALLAELLTSDEEEELPLSVPIKQEARTPDEQTIPAAPGGGPPVPSHQETATPLGSATRADLAQAAALANVQAAGEPEPKPAGPTVAAAVPQIPPQAAKGSGAAPVERPAPGQLTSAGGPQESPRAQPAAAAQPAQAAGPSLDSRVGEAEGEAAEATAIVFGEVEEEPVVAGATVAEPGSDDEGRAAALSEAAAASEGGLSDVATEMSEEETEGGQLGGSVGSVAVPELHEAPPGGSGGQLPQLARQAQQASAEGVPGLAPEAGLEVQPIPEAKALPAPPAAAAPEGALAQEGSQQEWREPPAAQHAIAERRQQEPGETAAHERAAHASETAAAPGKQEVPEAQQAEAAPAQQAQREEEEGPARQPSLLEVAEEMERRLASDADAAPSEAGPDRAAYQQDLLVASLVSQLDTPEVEAAGGGASRDDGYTDERGTVVGRLAAARAFLSPPFEPLFRGPQQHGMPSVLTKYRGMVAVGTSSGGIHVLMPAGKKDAQGQPRLMEVGERPSGPAAPGHGGPAGTGNDAVTALCFGQHGGSSLLMLSGHASGALKAWELKSHLTGGVNWALSKALAGVHGSAVTACAVLEGGATTWALSADAHGRLMCHNLSRHLSVAAQALTSFARQLTGAGSIPSHLISLQAAGQDPGVVMELAPLHLPQRGGGPPGPAADHTPDPGAFLFVPELGHFVLLCASRAILLCLLSQEGRMQVLHVFLPPLNTPADCSPYAAWHLEAPPQQGAAVSAMVAVAWQASVSVYRAVLLWRRPLSQGRRQSQPAEPAEPQPLPPPALLNTWALRNPVCGAFFLDSGALVVVASLGETATELLIYNQAQYGSAAQKLSQPRQTTAAAAAAEGGGTSGAGGLDQRGSGQGQGQGMAEAGVERMAVRDWVVGAQVGPIDGSTFHNGMASFGEQMLLLTSQGVRVAQLMTWQQRLSALIAQGRLQHALLAAVNIYHSIGRPTGGGLWPADGAGANPQEVSRQLLVIVYGLVDSALAALVAAHGEEPAAQTARARAEWLAEVSINACLLLRRPEALLSDVFPRWQPTAFLGVLLQQLEPHILRDQLPSLAPEVMQALVEHFVAVGQPERVERCVLKMDIMSLDLNQLIPLCLRHRLYGALLHIFTGALMDYQTPASLLLVASAAELDREAAERAGQACREGTGGGAPEGAGVALLAERAGPRLAYKLLVFLKCCLLGENFPPGCGTVRPEQQHAVKIQAVAFLLYATALSVWECWRLWGEMAHADDVQAVRELPISIADPHPALRLLCRMDAAATLGLLRRALHDWDAVEADLADIVPSMAQQLPASAGDRTITQAVIDAVVDLIQENALSAAAGSPAPTAAAANSAAAEPPTALGTAAEAGGPETTALQFVADHLASNRAVVPPWIVMRILGHLAAPAPAPAQQAQREGVFRDVTTHAFASLSGVDRQEVVWLARRAGFLQAEARVRELEGAHGEALACLVRDTRNPEAPFKYVRDLLADPSTPHSVREALQRSVMQLMQALMELNAASAAQLVLECFPEEQQSVLRGLSATPRLQFAFLQSLVEVQQRRDGDRGERKDSSEAAFKASSRDPRLQPLLADMAVANLFVELLCQFDPAAVLPFLQGHDSYGVDECLRQCLRHRVQDGAAFLLERRGDVHSALKIYIQALDGANRALVESVKAGGGQVDLLVAAALPTAGLPSQVSQQLGGPRPRRLTPLWGAGRAGALGGLPPGASQGASAVPELHAAQEALRSAIAVCIRYSQDRLGADAGLEGSGMDLAGVEGGAAAATADPVQRLWFQVLQGYVVMIRELRKEEQQLVASEAAVAEGLTGPNERDCAQQRLLVLQEIFTGFMEEVIRGMAGHVPLKSIAEAIIQQYGSDHFGDFKSTLLGLLGACNFELSILRCANRVMGSDGARILATGYQECSRPTEAPAP